ncbi:DsbA family protein [Stutzerimonas urumqiensis]|uniref:DsbA family protein n=1 Tax=Stutzerimonas urumqiensis TaxID=638269 RepID=UPI003BA9F70F
MSARLLYVMDPMCSWCWGFTPVIEALAERAARAGVAAVPVVGGLRSERQPLDPAGRVRILGHWQAVNAATGQLFDFNAAMPEGFVYDTEPACRAIVTARGLDASQVWRFMGLVQRAFYLEGADTTRASVLVGLAEEAGYSREAFAQRFDSPEAHQDTAADFDWVRNLGISGFPTVLAERDGRLALLTNGYQPLETLLPLLDRWLDQGAHA